MAIEENRETFEEDVPAYRKIFALLMIGIILIVVGMMVILLATVLYGGGSANAGAIIFIGPFPIVIGAGPDAAFMVSVSIIIAVLSIVVFLVINRKWRLSG
ncbi:MAG: DUF131 domain-containing protein [Candidatus Bathyarchaeota archaeon]|nr:DUF131 domain-containing protein [Candidatus Bathyarchaeota archaeon]